MGKQFSYWGYYNFREAANLRIQLEKALQANDPLKKVIPETISHNYFIPRLPVQLNLNDIVVQRTGHGYRKQKDASSIFA